MCRHIIFSLVIVLQACFGWAWSSAETNAVGCALAELTALSSGCDAPLPPDDPAANEPLEEP